MPANGSVSPARTSAASASSSPSVSSRPLSSARSTPPLSSPSHHNQQRQHQPRYSHTSPNWEEAAYAATTGFLYSTAMSPLARALQAQWRQQQQDTLSPSTLHIDQQSSTTAEDDVLRVLSSISKWAEMAVEDATHTIPYLLAFSVAPLPSLKTQLMALAALRGVLSSLPGVYGRGAASEFVEDIFLGEHQALNALCLCALVALDSSSTNGETKGSSPLSLAPALSSLRPRGGHRSLLSRGDATTASGDACMTKARLLSNSSRSLNSHSRSIVTARNISLSHPARNTKGETPTTRAEDLPSRIAHISLCLLNDVAVLCGAVANAILSSSAFLKASLRFLGSTTAPIPQSVSNVATALSSLEKSATHRRTAEDVIHLLLTLLSSESAQQNEVALVLCSYDAPRAVCKLAQSLTHSSYNARGAIHDGGGEGDAIERLLWNSLKVLGWLTRGCPSALKHFLSENKSLPSFFFQTLTVPVAEIREAAALWLAALLETQAHAALQLVDDLLDFAPTTTTASSSGEPFFSTMGALVEMLRWRGAQMHAYGVSAVLCWRWMLLSHPSRVAEVLPRDPSLLATLMELILRVQPSLSKPLEKVINTSSSCARGTRNPETKKNGINCSQNSVGAAGNAGNPTPTSLPLRLIALEAVHILALSFALGSLETRARLESQLIGGALSATTLHRLRDAAHYIIEQTHPAFYDSFPAMEVKLAEPELSENMRRTGATVVSPNITANGTVFNAVSVLPPRVSTSVVVQITAGAQWRQLILESLADLTSGEPSPSNALVPATRPLSSIAASSASSLLSRNASRRCANRRHPHLRNHHRPTNFDAPLNADVSTAAQATASAVAPIRVLGSSSRGCVTAARNTHHTIGQHEDEAQENHEGDEEEHRIDINSVISASLADSQSGAVVPVDACGVRIPRTVREATLLLTSQSTTTFRFRVVQQAEGLGGAFVQDSMYTVLQLAQHYTSPKASVGRVPNTARAALVRGSLRGCQVDSSYADPSAHLRSASPSAIFGSAPRFSFSPRKERNPFAQVTKAKTGLDRVWTIQDLKREDVLLFLVHYAHLMTELPEAIGAVEDHLYFLRRQLQLCPTRDVCRRCVLNDLYMNVYPTMHLFLRFINQQARRSRGVLQMLSSLNSGTIHSGNLLEAYDAAGQCTGLSVVE